LNAQLSTKKDRTPVFEPCQNFTDDFQKISKDSFDVAVRSYVEVSKGLQAIAIKVTDNFKVSFEDATGTFERLVSAKSIEQAIEIQSQYVKKAFGTYIAELSKLGELYASVARAAFKPVERSLTEKVA
jgi:hypothetical protein